MPESRPIFEFSAGGLVVDPDGRVLLIRARDLRNRAVWTLPKGALAPGEQSVDAALREVREETGYHCEIARELEPVTYWFQRNGRRVKKTVRQAGSSCPPGATSRRSASSTQSFG